MSTDTRLFVGNLPTNTNEGDLQAVFSPFGKITNLDLKSKSTDDNTKKNFAFVTFSANFDVESCLKHFAHHNFKGNRLYVTRARESFLERLERERTQAQNVKDLKQDTNKTSPKKQPVLNLSENLNPRKRKIGFEAKDVKEDWGPKKTQIKNKQSLIKPELPPDDGVGRVHPEATQKKQDSDKKRIESLKKKRQEFQQKKMIIKTGLTAVDKVQNKKLLFSDEDGSPKTMQKTNSSPKKTTKATNTRGANARTDLFEGDGDSDDNVNFQIKKQFEGKKGQKVLDLQSRYKSDKRFTLDERFIEDKSDDEETEDLSEYVELETADEKLKQLNILQDVLGVSIKSKSNMSEENQNKKIKSKLGMLRFDPSQPEHLKYLAPVEDQQEVPKKSKKKKKEKIEETKPTPEPEGPAVEVSKDQFYKVSETLKEAIAQPTTFSLRSLFNTNEDPKRDEQEQDTGYIPLEKTKDQKKKVKNPLDTGEKNPFVYDSSDSEDETEDKEIKPEQEKQEPVQNTVESKVIWKENLFFSKNDSRFQDGLAFFNKTNVNEGQKERRELKSLMKKRIYNKERKNQMFQKKIGGRKKIMKKNFKKRS